MTPSQAQTRATHMAALYLAGQTLQQIGNSYSLTRERVRQILRKHTAVTKRDGGAAERQRRRVARGLHLLNEKSLNRHGMGLGEIRRVRDLSKQMLEAGVGLYRTPLYAFRSQRNQAKRRGIGWELTFAQWWSIWETSGRWSRRGSGQGYVMCRYGDEGPYAVGNVFIATSIENCSKRKGRKTTLPTGVTRKRNSFVAHRCFKGTHYHIGSFPSPELAHAAYLAFTPQVAA